MAEKSLYPLLLTDLNNPAKILAGLGKCTRRGTRKCNSCGKMNGSKSLRCKNRNCGVILRVNDDKCKVDLDAVRLITSTVRSVYSVRVKDIGPDVRGFVQLPLIHSEEDSNILSEVALCFVDSCQRLFDHSILKCHEEETTLNEGSVCQHINAALKSCNIATPIETKNEILNTLNLKDDTKEDLFHLSTEKDGPLVQRVSKYIMAVKCQVTPKHPLGYLHFSFGSIKGKDVYDKFYCSCSEFSGISNEKSTGRLKCIHYYACVWALASDEKFGEEFKNFINLEFPVASSNVLETSSVKPVDASFKSNMKILNTKTYFVKNNNLKQPYATTKPQLKKVKTDISTNKIQQKLIAPKIFPIQINVLNEVVTSEHNASWEFMEWLSYVTESINKSMQFDNYGVVNTLVFHIPDTFYKCLKHKMPPIYKENISIGISNEEFFYIMNILHLKEIFDTSKIKLTLSKKFILNEKSGFFEEVQNESSTEEYQSSFIFFLNVGQSTIDESDNTNNSFFIEWFPNISTVTKIGQLRIQYKYGRKSTCILE